MAENNAAAVGSREERKQEPGINNGSITQTLFLVPSDRWKSRQVNNHGTEVTMHQEELCQRQGALQE